MVILMVILLFPSKFRITRTKSRWIYRKKFYYGVSAYQISLNSLSVFLIIQDSVRPTWQFQIVLSHRRVIRRLCLWCADTNFDYKDGHV